MKTAVTEIVLLGGGYVSVWAYRSLIKKLGKEIAKSQVHVSVICPEEYHFFHGWTAESLTCIIKDENRMSPLNELFTKATIVCGKASEINTKENIVQVTLKNGTAQQICYDHLLLGIGSFDSETIEGITKYGYQVKSRDAYLLTKKTLQQLVKRAAISEASTAAGLLTFTIAGCGFTGVELAANIAEFVNILRKQYASLQDIQPTIYLVNSGDKVLNALNPRFSRMLRYTENVLKNYRIERINNNRITQVTAYGAFLTDGSFIKSAMVISTIGQSRIVLKGTEHMERDNSKRLYTNTMLQINNYKNIWGGGDACHVTRYKTMEACPTNALWAIKHGEYVGRNIALAIKKHPLKPFKFKGLGQSASLGIGKGIGELYGIQFTGWLAWIMRFIVFNYFMPSRRVMRNEISDWMFLLFNGQRRGLIKEKLLLKTEPPTEFSSHQLTRRINKEGHVNKQPATTLATDGKHLASITS